MLALVPNARKKQSNATWVPAEPRDVHIPGSGSHDLAWWKKKVKTWKSEYNRPSLTVRITLWDIAGQRVPLSLSESEFSLEDLKKAKAAAEEHVSAGKGSARVYVHLDVAHTGSGNFDLGNYEPVGPTGFYLWGVNSDGIPVARRGPFADPDEPKEIGRTAARNGAYDQVLTYGDDPSQQGFEIVRRYRAGSGEVYTNSMVAQGLQLDRYSKNPRGLERGQLILWRFKMPPGVWREERVCSADTADQWLERFRRDEPDVFFKLSRTKPSGDPRLERNRSGLHSRSQEIREGQRWRSRSTGYVYLVTGVSDTAIEVTPSGPASNHIDADETRIYSFENFIEDFMPMRAVREYAANRRASAPYCSVPVDLFPERDGVRIMADQDRSAIVLNDGLEFVYLTNPLEYEQGDPERRLWILWVKGSRTVRVAWWGQLGSPRDEAMTAVSDWLEQTCFPGLSRGDETQSWGIDFSPGTDPGRWESIIRAAAFASAKIQKEGTTMSRNSSRALRANYTPHGYALVRDEDGRILEIERSRDYLERRWGVGRDLVELRRPHKVGDVIAYDHQGHESLAPNGRRIGRERMASNTMPDPSRVHAAMVRAGIRIDHHESDLYVPDTAAARAILKECGYTDKMIGRMLFGGTDGRPWLDVPFAYQPFWEKKAMKSNASRRYHSREDDPQLFPERNGIQFFATEDRGVMLVDPEARQYFIVNPLDYEKPKGARSYEKGSVAWVLWFGEMSPDRLLYWYNGSGEGLEDALEECAEWVAEHAPGYIMADDSEDLKELYEEAKAELVAEGEEEDEHLDGKAYEKATVDHTYTESGWIYSDHWGIDVQPDSRMDDGTKALLEAAAWVSEQLRREAYPDEYDED